MVTYTPEWTACRWGMWTMRLAGKHATLTDYHAREYSYDTQLRRAIEAWLEESAEPHGATSQYGQFIELRQCWHAAPEGPSPYCGCDSCNNEYANDPWPPQDETNAHAEWRRKMEELIADGAWP